MQRTEKVALNEALKIKEGAQEQQDKKGIWVK